VTEGERWTRELLAELRAARFSPAAWRRFFARSLERSRERRAERGRAHRQALVLGAAGLAGWTAVGLAGAPALGAAGGVWWLAVVVMLDWHLGLLERPDGTPLRGLGAANVLSLARAGLVPALFWLSPSALAAALVALAAADVADGGLARARGEASRLGLWLDPAVDTVTLLAAALVLDRAGALPGWATVAVAVRATVPWLAVAAIALARAELPRAGRYLSGRLPGLVLLTGLVLAALGRPEGAPLAAAGALAALATFGVSAVAAVARPAGSSRTT
jgi:CDP-diacylglycerol--glycerol-3-phosphate 3-phosphatidyltransferase/cardiolipin synthase